MTDAAKSSLKEKLEFDPKEDTLTVLVVIAGAFAQAIAINGFYVPHHFLSGGVAGVALLIDYLTGIPNWIFVIALNIPITLVGLKFLKPKMVIFSVIAVLAYALAAALTRSFDFGIENPLVSAFAGAVIIGGSSAMAVRRRATLGGIDIITAALSKRYSIPMGTFSIIFNVVIMGTLSIVKGLEIGLISMIAMFSYNMVFNAAVRGLNRSVTVFIISDRWDEIAPLVLEKMHRGVTYIPAVGAYSGAPKQLVYCVVHTSELYKLKEIVKAHDEHAMFTAIDTREVIGRGFGLFS